MIIITKKPEVTKRVDSCIKVYNAKGIDAGVAAIQEHILSAKIKFPLLEHAATLLYEQLPEEDHIPLCTKIEQLKTIGGNVLIGIILQQRLSTHFSKSLEMATHYISLADVWYVCDIIGERTYGYALLHYPEQTLPIIKKLSTSDSNWVIRSLGAGGHYAIKKGLKAKHAVQLFQLLLTMANTKDKEIRQGVGWAAKTTAKFHPDIIQQHQKEINNTEQVANWFRKKIEIGLNRNSYAQRN
ncbi:MAG: DNA alkylation repair protein [Flavipsychrobacter sp.]